MVCKKCNSRKVIKNGFVRGAQRYKCKKCGYNFIKGDKRVNQETSIKRAFAIILYSLGKASYGFIAKLFGVSSVAVYKWIKKEARIIDNPKIRSDIKEIEFDEMWHFVGSKKRDCGSLKPWIAAQGKPLPGLQAIVMLKHLESFTKK